MSNVIEFRRGKPRSSETKQKISRALKGKKRDRRSTSLMVGGGLAGGAAVIGGGVLLRSRLKSKKGLSNAMGAVAGGAPLGDAGRTVTGAGPALLGPGPSEAMKLLPPGRGPNKAMRMPGSLGTNDNIIPLPGSKGGAIVSQPVTVVANNKSIVTDAANFVKVRGQALSDTAKAVKAGYQEPTPTRVIQAGGLLGGWTGRNSARVMARSRQDIKKMRTFFAPRNKG